MRIRGKAILVSCGAAALIACSARTTPPATRVSASPPDDRARQVLNRLTFGARPVDLAVLRRGGVDAWVERQLHPERIDDRYADSVLNTLETQRKRSYELIADNPLPNEFIPIVMPAGGMMTDGKKPAVDSVGLARARAITGRLSEQIITAKLLRATFSERQLYEVVVDFWENHFSTSINKAANQYAIVDYDRDVIRPHALGKFRDLLGAVAKSPQMLFYLDNWRSEVDRQHPTIPEARIMVRRQGNGRFGDDQMYPRFSPRNVGLNENYARELLELHTMGVDGGYTQHDVTEVARCLTGWTIDRPDLGGDFTFRPEWHDAGEKVVLGHRIAAGRGMEDGEEVLDIVARHPSTARYIAKKLVIRLVSDTAPAALVERAAQTFTRTDGDIREVVRTIVTSPEFFDRAAYRAKAKTPFELMASALRVMNATPDTTVRAAYNVNILGQPLWARPTPDGWPDRAEAWLNAGALAKRINFAIIVASGQFPGVKLDRWRPAEQLLALAPERQVNAIVDELLQGEASSNTRAALNAVPAASSDRASQMRRLTDLVALALGSPEFQRR